MARLSPSGSLHMQGLPDEARLGRYEAGRAKDEERRQLSKHKQYKVANGPGCLTVGGGPPRWSQSGSVC